MPLLPIALAAVLLAGDPAREIKRTLAYAHIEASFTISEAIESPFDYRNADVQVQFQTPKGMTAFPAFYDGEGIWRVRYTPTIPGGVAIAEVTLNGRTISPHFLSPRRFTAGAATVREVLSPGFVRIDKRNPTAFAFDDGTPYYPIGQNIAWRSANSPEYGIMFAHLEDAGENWSRVWMNHWDGKNLDWVPGTKLPLGTLDLTVARYWDTIVAAAEASNIRFQMTLQHHGQYSTQVNPNWADNPWNRANGGFLNKPEEFFTSETARSLTKAKLRYIVARYGYSPNVLAWELFNEVQFTDAARLKQYPQIAAWHQEMADFLRAQDKQHHLITTSSDMDLPGLYDAVDYLQPHTYPASLVAATQTLHPFLGKKPLFFGEAGQGDGGTLSDPAVIHTLLWSSLASESSGAAQFWGWDEKPEDRLRYPVFAAATRFVRETDFARLSPAMRTIPATVQTVARGSVRFGPGGEWGAGKSDYRISESGTVEGIETMPRFLQGKNHPDLLTCVRFAVTTPARAMFTVAFRQVSKFGAHPRLFVDGILIAEHDCPATADNTATMLTLSAPLTAGQHTITLDNTGQDWAVMGEFALAPYGAVLSVLGKASANAAVFWVRSTVTDGTAGQGTITIPPVLSAGRYRVRWWNTDTGATMTERSVTMRANMPLILATPAIRRDAVVFLKSD